MILTDYYCFEKKPGCKSNTRMDCKASTQQYNPFERLRNSKGILFVYVMDNRYTADGERLKSDLALSSKGEHITSLYTRDYEAVHYYGDFKDTPDALLMICTGFKNFTGGCVANDSSIEIFVARGYRYDRGNLYNLFLDGELQDEIDVLRQRAQPEPPGALM